MVTSGSLMWSARCQRPVRPSISSLWSSRRVRSTPLAFYRDVIGLEVVEEWTDAGHGAVLSAGGPARVELIDLPGRARIDTESLFIAPLVGEIDGLYERATAAGHQIIREPADRPWGGRGFVVRDPNGVAVNIYTAYDR